VRFGLGLFPETWALVAPGLAILGAIGAVYGALTAIAQKTLNAWLPIVRLDMGYVLLGAAATQVSLVGGRRWSLTV